MKSVKIRLNTIGKVQAFVTEAVKLPFSVDIVKGKYTVDGKSIMGLFSLNLDAPVDCACDAEMGTPAMELFDALVKPFLVEVTAEDIEVGIDADLAARIDSRIDAHIDARIDARIDAYFANKEKKD